MKHKCVRAGNPKESKTQTFCNRVKFIQIRERSLTTIWWLVSSKCLRTTIHWPTFCQAPSLMVLASVGHQLLANMQTEWADIHVTRWWHRQNKHHKVARPYCTCIVPPYVDTLSMSRINIGDLLDESSQTLAQKDYREIRRAQREDKTIERWRIAVLDGTLPKTFMEKEDLTMKKQ